MAAQLAYNKTNAVFERYSLDYSSLDDAALVAWIAQVYGARSQKETASDAVGVLYDRYGRLVFSIALRVTGDTEAAEEITQDVFVRACESAGTYRPEVARVSSWLVSIARHRAIDELRRRGARPEKDSTLWPEDNQPDAVEDSAATPEVAVEQSMRETSIRRIIAELPPDQRQMLGLAFFQGLTHSQIAVLTNEPLGTVKSRIRLAMQKVRDRLLEAGIVDG